MTLATMTMKAKIIAGIVLVLALFGSGLATGWVVNGWRLNAGYEAERADLAEKAKDDADKAFKHYAEQIATASKAGAELEKTRQELGLKIDQTRQEYSRYAWLNPLPADCVLDAGRLRRIERAREAANAAITGSAGDRLPDGAATR